MKSYTVKLFPDEVIQKTGRKLDDILEYVDNKDGIFTIRKYYA